MSKFKSFGVVQVSDKIRYEIREYLECPNEGQMPVPVILFHFEVYKRPYFLGLLGSQKWCSTGDWVTIQYGTRWCEFLLKRWTFQ